MDKNKWVKNYAPEKDTASKREFDLVMFNTLDKEFYVIECKAHLSRDEMVKLNGIKKFNYVAINYGGRAAKKLIVTDTDLSFHAKNYAKKKNIQFINGKELGRMERKPETPYLPLISALFRTGLENIVKNMIKSY